MLPRRRVARVARRARSPPPRARRASRATGRTRRARSPASRDKRNSRRVAVVLRGQRVLLVDVLAPSGLGQRPSGGLAWLPRGRGPPRRARLPPGPVGHGLEWRRAAAASRRRPWRRAARGCELLIPRTNARRQSAQERRGAVRDAWGGGASTDRWVVRLGAVIRVGELSGRGTSSRTMGSLGGARLRLTGVVGPQPSAFVVY